MYFLNNSSKRKCKGEREVNVKKEESDFGKKKRFGRYEDVFRKEQIHSF